MKTEVKKLFFVLLTVVLLFALSACGGDKKADAPKPQEPAKPAETAKTKEEPKKEEPKKEEPKKEIPAPPKVETFEFDEYKVSVVGMELVKNDEKDAIRIYYEVTNKSDRIEVIASMLIAKVFQGETELEECAPDDPVKEYENGYLYVYPDVTMRICMDYFLDNKDKNVDLFLLNKYFDENGEKISVSLNNLLVPPKTPLEIQKKAADDPKSFGGFVEGVASFKSDIFKDQVSLKYLKHEFFEEEGKKYVRFYVDYKVNANEDKKPISAFMSTRAYIFQDGISLGDIFTSNYMMDFIPEDRNNNVDVEVGKSIVVTIVRELRTDSDILFVMSAWYNKPFEEEKPPYVGAKVSIK